MRVLRRDLHNRTASAAAARDIAGGTSIANRHHAMCILRKP
jgi:hypothetical protein